MIKTIKEEIAALESIDAIWTDRIKTWNTEEKGRDPNFLMRARQHARGQLDAYNKVLELLGL